MTACMKIIPTLMLLTSCLNQIRCNKRIERNSNRYITNWDNYGMPTEINVDNLKRILEDVALYKRGLYCPFGTKYEDCRNKNYHQVVSLIVADALGTSRAPEVAPSNALRFFALRSSSPNVTLNADTVYMKISVDGKNLDDKNTETERLKCRCHSVRKEKRLFGKYRPLKVPKHFKADPKKRRNKPFGKIFD